MEATAGLEDKVRDIESYSMLELYDKDILKSLIEDLPEQAKSIEYRLFAQKYRILLQAADWRKKEVPGLMDKVREAIAGSIDYTIRKIEENGRDLNAMHIRQNYRPMYNAVMKLGYIWEDYLEKLGISYDKYDVRKENNPEIDALGLIDIIKKLPEDDIKNIQKGRLENDPELLRKIRMGFETPEVALILAGRSKAYYPRADILGSAVREHWGKLGKSHLDLYNLIDNMAFRDITDKLNCHRNITPDIRPVLQASVSRIYMGDIADETMNINLNLVAGNRTIIKGNRKRDDRLYYDVMLDFRLVDEKFTPKAIDAVYMIGTSLTEPGDIFSAMEGWLKHFGFRLDKD